MNFHALVVQFKDIFFYKRLEASLSDCTSVLDVGCGTDSPLSKVKKKIISEGIDIFKPSIEKSRKKKIHTRYRLGDILQLNTFYKPKSFDAVIALDVVEHFTPKEGALLIKKMEKIARKKVVILTPNGFRHQHHDENPYEQHKSGWTVNKLRNMGYGVYGLRGLKFLRGEWATIKYRPWLFWGAVAFFSEPLLYLLPRFSYHLLAVKNISKKNKI